MTSFKVEVKTSPRDNWASNGLRFASIEDAQNYAINLSLRWLAVCEWQVVPSDDEPNR